MKELVVMQVRQTSRVTLAGVAVALAATLAAAGCGSSSNSSKNASSAPASSASASTSGGSSSSGSSSSGSSSSGGSSSASAVTGISGGNGFCSKLANFGQTLSTDLAGIQTSPQNVIQQEASDFKKLAGSAPSAIKKPLSDIANYFVQIEQALANGGATNPANEQKLEALAPQAQSLAGDGQTIGTWVASNCK